MLSLRYYLNESKNKWSVIINTVLIDDNNNIFGSDKKAVEITLYNLHKYIGKKVCVSYDGDCEIVLNKVINKVIDKLTTGLILADKPNLLSLPTEHTFKTYYKIDLEEIVTNNGKDFLRFYTYSYYYNPNDTSYYMRIETLSTLKIFYVDE